MLMELTATKMPRFHGSLVLMEREAGQNGTKEGAAAAAEGDDFDAPAISGWAP